MTAQNTKTWHAQPPEHCLAQLASNPVAGLDNEEVTRRLAEHGANRLAEKASRPVWLKFIDQFKSLLC